MKGQPDPILDLLGGKARAQAVSTAAELGLADALLDGPLALTELARRMRCEPVPLGSLARVLAGLGLLTTPAPDVFELTEQGRRLSAAELGPLAAFLGSPSQWDPWSRLRDAVRGGPCAFERTHREDLYAYLASHPEDARRYDAAIDAFTRHAAHVLCQHYDFSHARRVVDIGGGRGALLETLLSTWDHLHGTLFELPHVVEFAAPGLVAKFGGRVAASAGDFLQSVPAGADHYVLKHVLHNWSDEDCVRILRNCVVAMEPGGRVLVMEAVRMPDGRADTAALLDLDMLVLTGGRERRRPELRRLLQSADLRVESVHGLTPTTTLFVASDRRAS